MRLEGLGQLKNPMTSSGIEPATFRLAAYCLNQLRYRMTQDLHKKNVVFSPLANYTDRAITAGQRS
jgi:hypothetical protein